MDHWSLSTIAGNLSVTGLIVKESWIPQEDSSKICIIKVRSGFFLTGFQHSFATVSVGIFTKFLQSFSIFPFEFPYEISPIVLTSFSLIFPPRMAPRTCFRDVPVFLRISSKTSFKIPLMDLCGVLCKISTNFVGYLRRYS